MAVTCLENNKRHYFCSKKSRIISALFILFVTAEFGLSIIQFVRRKGRTKPYHVTFILRPIVKLFVHDDFYPRTHQVRGVPWDYRTDRMIPGKYEQGHRLPEYTINSYGIRGKEFSIPKPDGVFRIIVFGSSTALGTNVADHETYPAILEEILDPPDPYHRVEVLNYGFSGKSLYHNARHYFLEIDRLDPDIVIINNIRNTWFYDQRQDIADYWDILIPQRYGITKVSHFLTDNLLVARLVRKIWRKNIQNNDMRNTIVDGRTASYNYRFFESLYYDIIHGIYQDAQSRRDASVMYIFEPTYIDPKTQLSYKNLANDELLAELGRGDNLSNDDVSMIFSALLYNNIRRLKSFYPDVIVLDPISTFLQSQEGNPADPVFADHIHLTKHGNELLAQMIASKLRKTEHFK